MTKYVLFSCRSSATKYILALMLMISSESGKDECIW